MSSFGMIKYFYSFLPSHSNKENFIKICRHVLLFNLCVSYYIAFISGESVLMFLNSVVIYPVLVMIARFKINTRILTFLNDSDIIEEEWELNLRLNTDLRKPEKFTEFMKRVHLRLGDDLKVGLVESKYYSEVFKNYDMSLLKLTRLVYFTRSNENNVLRQFEIVYEAYCHFDYLLSKVNTQEQRSIYLGLEIKAIKKKDIDTCSDLLRFLEKLSFKNVLSGYALLSNSESLMAKLESLRKKYVSLLKEFPGEREFSDFHATFKEILSRESSNKIPQRKRGKKDLTTANFQSNKNFDFPLIIANADPENIGNIVYMNIIAKTYLKHGTDCKHLKYLIPGVQKKNINEYLRNLFSGADKTLYEFPCFCLQKINGFLILVKLKIILSWYKYKPYFILTFVKYPNTIHPFLADSKMKVLAQTKSIAKRVGLVDEMKDNCLATAKDYEPVPFDNRQFYTGYIKVKLPVFTKTVNLFMLFSEFQMFEKLTEHYKDIQISNTEQYADYIDRIMCQVPQAYSMIQQQPRMTIISDRNEHLEENKTNQLVSSSSMHKQRQERLAVIKRAVSLYTRPIQIGMKIVFFIYFLSSVIVICLTEFGISEIVKNIAIDELGKMRSLTQGIVSSTRSLLLLSGGYEMEFSEEHYRSTLKNSAEDLKELLLRFQDEVAIDILLKKRLFTKYTVHVYDKIENQIDASNLYLSESLRKLADKAVALESNSLHNMTDYYYILRNGPTDILTVLNTTVHEALEITLDRIDLIEYIYTILCALIFVPSFITIIIATPSIRYFETINQRITSSFSKIKSYSIIEIGGIIQERLMLLFDEEEVADYGNKPCKTTMSMWTFWRYTIGPIIAATLASYFLITLIYPTKIFSIIKQQPIHDFWYGYSRLIPIRSYYWTREAYLDAEGTNSYSQLFPQNSPVSDMIGMTLQVAEEYQFLAQNIRFYLKDSYTHTIEDYNTIFYGKACQLLTDSIANCEKTLVAKGIYLGVLDFIDFINSVGYMTERGEVDWSTIRKLERNSGILNNACSELMSLVTNSSESILVDLISVQITLSTIVFTTLGVFMFAVMKRGLLRVAKQMKAKVKIATIIDENSLVSLVQSLGKDNGY